MAAIEARRSTRNGCSNRAVEFKCELAAAACTPSISVAKLALEHSVNTKLLFEWRRQCRAGDFGAPDPAHVPAPSEPESPAAASAATNAVTLPPVQAPATVPADAIAASACIEIVFRNATVRICGTPEIAPLRAVLDALARRS